MRKVFKELGYEVTLQSYQFDNAFAITSSPEAKQETPTGYNIVLGYIGSHEYLKSLAEDDADNIVGMINFDMLASKEWTDLRQIVTCDGYSNYLTDMFPEFTLIKKDASDHTSFFGQAIPSMSFNDHIDSAYHPLMIQLKKLIKTSSLMLQIMLL